MRETCRKLSATDLRASRIYPGTGSTAAALTLRPPPRNYPSQQIDRQWMGRHQATRNQMSQITKRIGVRSPQQKRPGEVSGIESHRIPHDWPQELPSPAPPTPPAFHTSPGCSFNSWELHLTPAFNCKFHQFYAFKGALKMGKAPVKGARSFLKLRRGGQAGPDMPVMSGMPSWMLLEGPYKWKS